MAKQRYINTKFWSDNFVVELNPLDRYLFLYLLTNEHTNIAGIYELPLSRMAQETGIDKEMLPKMLKRLQPKVQHVDGWVIFKNFQKHQKGSEKIKTGIASIMEGIPDKIRTFYTNWPKKKDRVSIPSDRVGIESELSESNLNLNSNPNLIIPAKPVKNEFGKVIEQFFALKGWPVKGNGQVFRRYLRSAKELYELCEYNLEETKACLQKVNDWATSRNLDWSIETVFKKWYDIDLLRPKEKKAYFEDKRIFQKVPGGKWWCISRDGEIRELGLWPKEDQIIYK